jgi:uncharacterized protein (TIGR03790 family)
MITVLACGSAWQLYAGGSGLNVLVVVNQNSSNSCEVGNYYCERRQVPPENQLRIAWPGGSISWTNADFQTYLLNPLLAALSSRQLSYQIDYVVLSMDIPYQTINQSLPNGTTSALFYGPKIDSGPMWPGITNSYYASEQIFSQAKPASAPGYAFLTTMVTANSVAEAKKLVDQGVASDGIFPPHSVLLAKSSDPLRNIRYRFFDNAIFNTRLARNYSAQRTNTDSLWGQPNLLGFQTGLAYFSVPTNLFTPGAMADSMTSYGGLISGQTDQTTLMAFINAGASGSYGTVTEPAAVAEKFPDPQNYFYQSRGFSLAECYYQGIFEPYEGLIVAEPLAAPWQQAGSGKWMGINSNVTLSGTAQLSAQFAATDGDHPLQQVDLFVDGKYFRTLTNLAPAAGNALTVALNGYPVNYTVLTNSTLAATAAGMTAALNAPAVTNATKVVAFAHGDRIELHDASTNRAGEPVYFTDIAPPFPFRFYRVISLPESSTPTLTVLGGDLSGGFRLHFESPALTPVVLQASTNLVTWLPLFTNLLGGPFDFVDNGAAALPRRFYRAAASLPDTRPKLTVLGKGGSGGFQLRVESPNAAPYILAASTNLVQWTALATNLAGSTLLFEDSAAPTFPRRFYRATVLPQPAPDASIALVNQSANGTLFRVDGASGPFMIQASTDLAHWTAIYTNLSVRKATATTTTAKGSASALTSFLSASRETFLDSPANGLQPCLVNGTLQPGTWLQLKVTKANGSHVTVAATNQSFSATIFDLTTALANAINTNLDLQGNDGLVAEDLAGGTFGAGTFNLRTRSSGLLAAGLKVLLRGANSLLLRPIGEVPLNQNLSDLQPRNHLFATAGATNLSLTFALDTTALADGFHDLTAVAYEGSHVRTQTRIFLTVNVRNTPLSATLTALDFTNTAPVQGTYHLQVAANTNNVSAVRLYATGGLLNTVSNQATATFTFNGSSLGAGLHPLYGVVSTSAGKSYRTQTRWVHLTNGP